MQQRKRYSEEFMRAKPWCAPVGVTDGPGRMSSDGRLRAMRSRHDWRSQHAPMNLRVALVFDTAFPAFHSIGW